MYCSFLLKCLVKDAKVQKRSSGCYAQSNTRSRIIPFHSSCSKAKSVVENLKAMKPNAAAKCVSDGHIETLTYTRFPMPHWRRIRTNNAIERLNREIRRRTRVAGTFPYGKSALMFVTARLKYVADSEWGLRRYLDISLLDV